MKVVISGEKEYIAGFCQRFGELYRTTIIGERPGINTWLERIKEANIKEKDVFIACGNDSNENIILCVLAKQLGVQKVYCFINNADCLDLFNKNAKGIFSFDQLIFIEKVVGEHFAKMIRKNKSILEKSDKKEKRAVFIFGKSLIGNCLIDELNHDTDIEIVHEKYCEHGKFEKLSQHINDSSYIFVLTDNDEHNLYTSLKLKASKFKNVITLVNKLENEEIFRNSGLETLINSKNEFSQNLIWSFFEQT